MLASAVKLLRAASVAICLIVIASFAVFAVNQTKNASAAQTEELNAGASTPSATPAAGGSGGIGTVNAQKRVGTHEKGVHQALDETSNALTSPFSGVVSSSDSEWVTRGVRLLFALLVYGFGLGFLARTLRVRI